MADIFNSLIHDIVTNVEKWADKLARLPDDPVNNRRNSQNRTLKQILGHLIDSATNNHHRIVRLQYNNELEFPDYRQDNDTWIRIQDYQNAEWSGLVSFWKFYNLHMAHMIARVNKDALGNTWRDCDGNVETLQSVIEGYVWHLNLHLKEINALLDSP